MLIPISLLKKYVNIELSPGELAHRLTMAGTEISNLKEIGINWDREKLVVGHVEKVDPHPNADRLVIPTVNLGNSESVAVVCGAPNVAAGQNIAFAREGCLLYSSKTGNVEKLKPAKIRGILSIGMVCSPLELGLGDDHSGILVLDNDVIPGTPLVDYLGDTILDAEITPNRPDCLSILGIAREVSAITNQKVREPKNSYPENGDPIDGQVAIQISDPELCSRYTASIVSDIVIGPSPKWIQDALLSMGHRPINNVVDVTNFVMLEYGQPMHAFDFDTIPDNTIIVRSAMESELLNTLDGETKKLAPPMLTIANSNKALALAGVIGGTDTAVTENTTKILLESASFDPINTRRTSASLRLSTDASYRFERGIRTDLAPIALRRATKLLLEITGGVAARGVIDIYPNPKAKPTVAISQKRIKQSLGLEIDISKVETVLSSLGFGIVESRNPPNTEGVEVTVPYWRSDISIEDDLIEEIARIIGYDNIPTTMLSTPIPHHEPNGLRDMRENLRDSLVSEGMQESISYSLTNIKTLDAVGAIENGPKPLRISNPMSIDMQVLRTSLRGGILQTLSSNLHISRSHGLKLFEIGNVYLTRTDTQEPDLPEERQVLVGVLAGPRNPLSWLTPHVDMDFFDAKGVLEASFGIFGIVINYLKDTDPIMHPGKTASLSYSNTRVGLVGELHPKTLLHFDIDQPVTMFEIDLPSLYEVLAKDIVGFTNTPRFPESERDFTLTVDIGTPSSDMQSIIEQHSLVVRSVPFDIYSGSGVPSGKKSVTYKIVFQSSKGTLTSVELDQARTDILRRLEREVGAELRSQN